MSSPHALNAESVEPKHAQRGVAVATFAALTVIAGLAIWLRVHALDAKSLWMDEGVSAAYTRLDLYNLARILWRREANMTLYYVLLRLWSHLGDSVAWYRALSVVFSVGTVPLLYAVGKRLFGTMAGLIAAMLFAVNAYSVRYAQDARSYSLAIFLVTASTYFFVRATETGKRSDWKWYIVTSVLSVYAHFFAVLVIPAHWLSLRASQKDPQTASVHADFVKAAKRIALWTIPVWVFILTTGVGTLRWMHRPGLSELYGFVEQYAGNGGWRLLCLYAVCFALAAGTAIRVSKLHGHSFEAWRYAVVFGWFLVPVLIPLAVTLIKPVFLARYVSVCLPGLILAVAAGLTSLKYRLTSLAVLGVIVWLAIGGVRSYYRQDFDLLRQDYRGVTAFVLQNANPGDAILFQPGQARCAYQYYAEHSPAGARPMIVFPGNGDRMTWRDFMGSIQPQALERAASTYPRMWVIAGDIGGEDETSQRIKSVLSQHDALAARREFSGVDVYLYQSQTAPAQ